MDLLERLRGVTTVNDSVPQIRRSYEMRPFQDNHRFVKFVFVSVAFLMLTGCAPVAMMPVEAPQPQAVGPAHAPVIEDGFAVSSLWGGETWRVFLRGSDPDGDMSHLWVVVTQVGKHTDTEIIPLKGRNQQEFSGYLTLDTPAWIRTWDAVRVEVRIRDRAGNLSEKVTLEAQIGFPTRERLPSEWASAAQYHLGVLFFQFQDDNGNGKPFGRKGRF
jgi:hypothetical protein